MVVLSASALFLLSDALGWTYFLAWAASFLPQLVLNYRRKSVAGFSPDFATTNPIGYFSLSVFNLALFFSAKVRSQYAGRHHGGRPAVSGADVAFAIYAFTASTACYVQTWIYPAPPSQRLSTYNRLAIPALALGITAYGLVVYSGVGQLELLDWLLGFSWIKIYITFTKYVPQVLLNRKRQSTKGWSITNILLDSTGGVLSLAQLILDAYLSGTFLDTLLGNPSKLGMAGFSIAFDGVFLVQHYWLYSGAEDGEELREERKKALEEADAEEGQGEVSAETSREDTQADERTPLLE